jgi:chromosome segregation ATPase
LLHKDGEKKSLENRILELEKKLEEKCELNEQSELLLKSAEDEIKRFRDEARALGKKIILLEQEADSHRNFNEHTIEMLKSTEFEKKRLIIALTESENKVYSSKEDIEKLTAKIASLEEEMEHSLRQYENAYNQTRYSYSYRLGRALLFPLIKLRAWSSKNKGQVIELSNENEKE